MTAELNPAPSKWVHCLLLLGRLRHLVGLVQRTEPEAEQQLLHGAAHDLTNYLLGIRGYCELALAALDRNADARTEIHGIMLATDRAKVIVRQLDAFRCTQVQRPEILSAAADRDP